MSQRGTCVATNGPSFRCMTCWDSGEIERFVALNEAPFFIDLPDVCRALSRV